MRRRVDYVVIGSGVAGLFFALKAAEAGAQVLVLTKTVKGESNTAYAQGGIAGVFADADSFEKHVEDTLIAGDGLCKPEIVHKVVSEGPARIRELMAFGAKFDRDQQGELRLGREGGHSENRILHSGDATGAEIARALIAAAHHKNIEVVEHLFALDLLTQHHLGRYVNRGHPDITCFGVYALDIHTRIVHTILAKVTVLASGGAGNVYASTTNPMIATGDGVAMALRAKARIANMEFYQFHPTALYDPSARGNAFLITEALRGKGAYLRNSYDGSRFMLRVDKRGELAPRDIVARAIDNEIKLTGTNFVHLDARHIDPDELKRDFPTIDAYLKTKGLDLSRDLIPVVPAAHYMCGGVETDAAGRTSIKNLYAIGECSCTGLHGANRLASNSLLEAVVFADAAFLHTRTLNLNEIPFCEAIPDWDDSNTEKPEEWILISHNIREVQHVMTNYVGIVRTDLRLERAARRIDLIHKETDTFYQRTRLSPELCELRNLIAIAYLIIKSAMIRKESRGLHFNTDYPNKLPEAYDTVL